MPLLLFNDALDKVKMWNNLSSPFLQYIHGLAARGVHYLHRPGPVLQDVGFFLLPVSCWLSSSFSLSCLLACTLVCNFTRVHLHLFLQELGQDKAYISETVFTFIFISFVLVSIIPFWTDSVIYYFLFSFY